MSKNVQMISKIEHFYYDELDTIKRMLEITLKTLSSSPVVIDLLKSKNREALFNVSRPYFENSKRFYNGISIMHYHSLNHRSFLRVHKKNIYGDNLQNIRLMITKAIKEKKIIKGYEHGKHDNNMFTYRIAYPIFDGENLLAIL